MLNGEFLRTFSIQIGLIAILIFFTLRNIFASFILKIWKKISKSDFEIKDHKMYKTLKLFFIFLGFVVAMLIIPFNERIIEVWNGISRIVLILFITKLLTAIADKDSKIMQKTIASSNNETVNTFICKIIRFIIWVISTFIIIKELGYDLTGLAAGLGIRKCYNIFGCSRYSKKLA